jgi:solute:Na+ symporter, SSS family
MAIIDWVFLGLYFALLIVIGVQTIRRIETPEDFAVAGNRIIWPVFFGSLAASFLGGGSSLGNAGETFKDGYVYMFAFFAFAIQTVLVGYFVAPRLKRYAKAQTVGDIMENHYGSTARLLTGILSVAVCAGILGAQALAVGTIFNTILGVSTTVGILIGMSIVVLYSTFGGVWAVIQTDMLQFVFLGVFLPVTLIIGLIKVGGPEELMTSVPNAHLSFMGTWTLGLFVSVFLAFLLGETLVPPYTQRAFSTPDPANARKGYMMSGIFAFFFFFVSASIGLVALALYPNIAPDQAVPTVVKNVVPVGLVGLVVAALLAVVMSTASSYLNSIAVVFVKDIYLPFINPNLSASRKVWLERGLSLVVGGAAILFAVSVPSIVDALLYSYALWAPTIIIPLILAVMWGFRCKPAALSAIVAGGGVAAVWTWVLNEPFGITGLVAGLVVNVVVFAVVYKVVGGKRRRSVPVAVSEGK